MAKYLCDGRNHWNVCERIDKDYDNGNIEYQDGFIVCPFQCKRDCIRQFVDTTNNKKLHKPI